PEQGRDQMGFRYQLRLADREDAGVAEYAYQPSPGDLVYVNGARQMRVTAVVRCTACSRSILYPESHPLRAVCDARKYRAATNRGRQTGPATALYKREHHDAPCSCLNARSK